MSDLKHIERLELAAADAELLAALHWTRCSRDQFRRDAVSFRIAAQKIRDRAPAAAA